MFQDSNQWLELILASSGLVLCVFWVGRLVQKGPRRKQRWCEAGIAVSVVSLVLVFLPTPVPGIAGLRETALPVDLSSRPQRSDSNVSVEPVTADEATPPMTVVIESPVIEAAGTAKVSESVSWRTIGEVVYFSGAIACLLFLLIGRIRLYRLEAGADKSSNPQSSLPPGIQLLVSQHVSRPMCYGILKPRVLLPASVDSSSHRDHVLRHEATHISRKDALTCLGMNLAMPLLYVNPFYWFLRRIAIQCSEHVADAEAASASSATDYATGMIELARSSSNSRMLLPVVGGWKSHSALTQRIEWLMKCQDRDIGCSRGWTMALSGGIFSLLSAVLCLFGCAPSGADAPGYHLQSGRLADVTPVKDPFGSIWTMTQDLPGTVGLLSNCDVHTVQGVVRFNGEPVADAEVRANAFGVIHGCEKVATDSDGRFRISLPLDPRMNVDKWHLIAFHDGRFGVPIKAEDDLVNSEVTINLKEGCDLELEIRARVSDAVLPGARVFPEDGRILDGDNNGQLSVSGLPVGIQKFVVTAPGHERQLVKCELSSTRPNRLVVRLEPGAIITGRVTDKNNFPVANNPVGLWNGRLGFSLRTMTDKDGFYSYDGAGIGNPIEFITFSHMTSERPEWEENRITVGTERKHEVNFSVRGGHSQEVDAEKGSGLVSMLWQEPEEFVKGGLRGQVLFPDGTPANEFRISYGWPRQTQPDYDGKSSASERNLMFTHPAGEFEIRSLDEGCVYRLIASVDGYQDAIVERAGAVSLNDVADMTPLTLKLKPALDLAVTVTSRESNESIPEAEVWMVPYDPDTFLGAHRFGEKIYAKADSSGRAFFHDLPYGDGVVIVEKTGLGTERFAWRGEAAIEAPMARPATVVVKIKRPFWAIARAVRVYLQRHGSGSMSMEQAEPGDDTVAFKGLTAAKYEVSIDGGDYQLKNKAYKMGIGIVAPGESKAVSIDLIAAD